MYTLLLTVRPEGWGELQKPVYRSADLKAVKEKLTDMITGGTPKKDLFIVKDVPYELKCAVVVKEEEEA